MKCLQTLEARLDHTRKDFSRLQLRDAFARAAIAAFNILHLHVQDSRHSGNISTSDHCTCAAIGLEPVFGASIQASLELQLSLGTVRGMRSSFPLKKCLER